MDKKFLLFVFCAFLFCLKLSAAQKKVVCYHTNWSQYRPDGGKFYPEDIDPHLCTHIIYSFAKISGDTLAAYEWNDEDTAWSKGMYSRTMALKNQNPNLKILIAVGGWNHGSAPFSTMVHNTHSRNNFVQNSIEFLKKNGFDGLDLDWEYPGNNEGKPTDKALFTTLVKELKAAYQPHNLLLTAAVAAGKKNIDNGYEIDKIAQDLDWINLMAYDYHGAWDPYTGHNAPLYARSNEVGDQVEFNVDFTVDYWLNGGTPKEKLVLGMGNYGRSFRLTDPNKTNPGDGASGGASAGVYTREAGYLAYYEVCQKLSQGWTEKWDDEAKVPYAYQGGEWVGYDNIRSIQEKVNYSKLKGLGGIMFWALDCDDFKGQFCGQGRYPLINAAKSELNNGVLPQSTTKQVTASTTTIATLTSVVASSTTSTTPSVDASVCTNGDGYYQDLASGCQNYFLCAFTGTIRPMVKVLTCPEGLLFDITIKACNYASSVKCEGGSLAVSVTSSSTTTTTTVSTTIQTTTISTTISGGTNGGLIGCLNGDGYYPDVLTDCTEYYLCAFTNTPSAQIFRFACPNGFKFDSVIKACSSSTQCGAPIPSTLTTTTTTTLPTTTTTTATITPTTTPTSTTTSSLPTTSTGFSTQVITTVSNGGQVGCWNGDGYYPDGLTNCNEYYLCAFTSTGNAQVFRYACPTGYKFDADVKACSSASSVKCDKPTTISTTISTTTTTPTTTTTATTTTTTTTTTVETTTVSTTSDIPTTTKIIPAFVDEKCSQGDGIYMIPSVGCTKYFECIYQGTEFARTILYDCPGGTLFDVNAKQCLWKDQVNCSN